MVIKLSAFNEAPPISPPSTSGLEKSSLAFPALQLPPYRIEVLSAVEKIWEVSESGVLFETKNIIYRLNYTTANAKTGVICA